MKQAETETAFPVYMIQGENGPEEAFRPDVMLERLYKLPLGDARLYFAYNLAFAGVVIDSPIDAYGGDYEKTMQQRRAYGYTWVPSALMPNIPVAPAPGQPPSPAPYGAILVPPPEGWS